MTSVLKKRNFTSGERFWFFFDTEFRKGTFFSEVWAFVSAGLFFVSHCDCTVSAESQLLKSTHAVGYSHPLMEAQGAQGYQRFRLSKSVVGQNIAVFHAAPADISNYFLPSLAVHSISFSPIVSDPK